MTPPTEDFERGKPMPLTEKDELTEKLGEHKRNLRRLQEKEAKYGIDVPVWVQNQIEGEKKEIARLEAELKLLEGQPDRLVPALRDYVDQVYHECRYLETEGEPEMPLTEVYVMLQAQPTPRREQETDLPPGQSLPQEMEREAALARKEPPAPLPEVLRQHQHLLILGEPGAGKTTLLQYIALCFTNDLRAEEGGDHQPNLDDLGLPDEPRLPLRIELRNYQGKRRLDDFIVASLYDRFVPETLARAWLEGERLALLLDGLDEVPIQNRAEVIRLIQNFARDSQGRNQRIVVTSRIAAYREGPGLDEEDFKPYTLRPLDDEETARHYVAGWLRALDSEKEGQANILWTQLKEQRSLKGGLTNPLLLRLAISVYARTGEVARSRAALYRLYVEDVLIPRAEARGLELPPRRIQEALEAVAWAMQVEGAHDEGGLAEALEQEVNGVEDGCALLMNLRVEVGLLIAYGREARELRRLLAFRHLTFQEYFVARRLTRRWKRDADDTWAWLRPHLYEDDWRETALLLGSLLREKEATDFLGRIIREPQQEPQESIRLLWELPGHLKLVVEALIQGACPTDAFQKQVSDELLSLARDERVDAWVRKNAEDAAEALGRLGQTEALLALARDEQVDALVRREVVEALGRLGQTEILLALARDEKVYTWLREKAARALGCLGQTEVAAEILLALAHDERVDALVRKGAADALGRLGQTDKEAEAWLALARDEQVDAWVRYLTADALGRLGQADKEAEVWLALARDEQVDTWMRYGAVKALGRLGQTEALLALARDEQVDALVRYLAANALGRLGQTEALLALARDEQVDALARYRAAEALGRLGQATEAVLSGLKEVAEHDPVEYVRQAARNALQRLQEKQSHPQYEDEDKTLI